MKKVLVVYYSKTGSNLYLAARLAQRLNGDLENIRPRVNVFFWLLMESMMKFGFGIRRLRHNVEDYDAVILCGPIWTGQLISPLRSFVKRYGGKISDLHFATCCGGSDAVSKDPYGYMNVFAKVEALLPGRKLHCAAFPIPLVVSADKLDDGATVMKTRLTDENFRGEILERFEDFAGAIVGLHAVV